ncbi:uncharacterized protein BX663DRAFT_553686 [Cokeromyces recurvatus]|uniref:uncharacterized protein n=1 Tax=Cokeromyces recurvatus TaxID=90255 RepID=UPI00221FD0E4|nr:uncharacterized protein BX663DRAFT_553686 [Cokeromyces recurvatus]KAI7901057.1 hypothetical protein BX663DRAFT_553686 [Cokeromyces recurvatus]
MSSRSILSDETSLAKSGSLAEFMFISSEKASAAVLRGYQIKVKSDSDFCSFMPPHPGDDVAATENDGVPFCTRPGLGGKAIFPSGFIKSAHFKSTSLYVQVTGTTDRGKYSLKQTDGGGQYDNKNIKSTTCNGYPYFVNLIEPDSNHFCIRCCKRPSDCNVGISSYGCERVVPGDYS